MKCYVFIGRLGVNNEHNNYNAELIVAITLCTFCESFVVRALGEIGFASPYSGV